MFKHVMQLHEVLEPTIFLVIGILK